MILLLGVSIGCVVLVLGMALVPLLGLSWELERVEQEAARKSDSVLVGPDKNAALADGQALHTEIIDHLERKHRGKFGHNIFINQESASLEMEVFFLDGVMDESQLLPLWEYLSEMQPKFAENNWQLDLRTQVLTEHGEVAVTGFAGQRWAELSRVLEQPVVDGARISIDLATNTATLDWDESGISDCGPNPTERGPEFFSAAMEHSSSLLKGLGWSSEQSPGLIFTADGCGGQLSLHGELVNGERAAKLAALSEVYEAAERQARVKRMWIIADHLPPAGEEHTDGRGELSVRVVSPDGSSPGAEFIEVLGPELQEQWRYGSLSLNGFLMAGPNGSAAG
ncbi:hypothetical protein [Corynebacterium sp. A21]|uniref:hypothetical protein n=1 Tax=Corynebacterium sp. A21 TaxID=3457318 RepID=UPI003FCF69C4